MLCVCLRLMKGVNCTGFRVSDDVIVSDGSQGHYQTMGESLVLKDYRGWSPVSLVVYEKLGFASSIFDLTLVNSVWTNHSAERSLLKLNNSKCVLQ